MQFAFLGEIGRRHGMNRDGSEFPELLMLPCPPCQNDQVTHGGIVRFFMQAVRIDKMRGAHAELGRIVVHQRDKACDTAGYVFRNHVAGLIGRGNHDTVQQLPQRKLFSGLQSGRAAADDKILQRRLSDGQDIIQIPALQRDHACHDLSEAGGIHQLVYVLPDQKRAGVEIDQSSGLGLDIIIRFHGIVQQFGGRRDIRQIVRFLLRRVRSGRKGGISLFRSGRI